MATYTVQTVTEAGITPAYTAVGATDTFTPAATDYDKTMILHVKNAGASPDSVSVADPNTQGPAGATAFNPAVTVSVTNAQERMIRLAPIRRYVNTSTGAVTVTHSFLTTVTAGVFVG